MKKSYVKPKVYFENFQLSANIASGCGVTVGHDPLSCYNEYVPNGMGLFGGEYTCRYDADDEGMCYQVITDGSRLFDS